MCDRQVIHPHIHAAKLSSSSTRSKSSSASNLVQRCFELSGQGSRWGGWKLARLRLQAPEDPHKRRKTQHSKQHSGRVLDRLMALFRAVVPAFSQKQRHRLVSTSHRKASVQDLADSEQLPELMQPVSDESYRPAIESSTWLACDMR